MSLLIIYILTFSRKIYAQFEIPFNPESHILHKEIERLVLIGVSRKEWEGPYEHDIYVSGTAVLPCVQRSTTERHLQKLHEEARISSSHMGILWVHQTWYNVVDPWLGDGRRSYDTLQVTPHWSSSRKPNFNQSALYISDVEQPDNGVYACVAVHYALELQISPVILNKAELISVHLLRVRSGLVVAPGCEPDQATSLQFCQTGFERWTFHAYYPVGKYTGDILFQAQCHSEVFLTALALGHISPTLWSVGWKFVPYGQIDNLSAITIYNSSSSDLVQPVELCIPDGPRSCSTPKQYTQLQQQQAHTMSGVDLDLAYTNSRKLWRARWLLLVGTQPQQSGTWQCWIQGVASTDRDATNRKSIKFLTTEVHVHMIREGDTSYGWWRSVEIWRVLLMCSVPLSVVLGFSVFCIGWIAARLYADRLPTLSNPVDFKTGFYDKNQAGIGPTFDAEKYMKRYLIKSGVKSYNQN